MTETQADDLVVDEESRRGASRWQAIIGLVGLIAIAVAVASTVGDVRGRTLPNAWALAGGLVLSLIGVGFAGTAWASLFPPHIDRRALASALYTSQLTKYLPVGGLLQVASQVTLAGQTSGLGSAALRLPVYSMCTVCAGATLGAFLAFADSLPVWGRVLTGLGVFAPLLLDRRILSWTLRLARRVIHRLPDTDELPAQRLIISCYLLSLGTLATYAAAFTLLLRDLADVPPVQAAAALCVAWVIGYLAVPFPSGIGVREAILFAALPGLGAGPLLTASLAHRLLAILAEVSLAGTSILRLRRARKPSLSSTETP